MLSARPEGRADLHAEGVKCGLFFVSCWVFKAEI